MISLMQTSSFSINFIFRSAQLRKNHEEISKVLVSEQKRHILYIKHINSF